MDSKNLRVMSSSRSSPAYQVLVVHKNYHQKRTSQKHLKAQILTKIGKLYRLKLLKEVQIHFLQLSQIIFNLNSL